MPKRQPDVLIAKEEALRFLYDISLSGELHIDVETTGLTWHQNNVEIVSIGLANEDGNVAIDVRHLDTKGWHKLFDLLTSCQCWAYNMVFDGGVLFKQAQRIGYDERVFLSSLQGCTLTLFRGLGNEGYKDVHHSLEEAMGGVMLWEDLNKDWLKEALHKHKLTKNVMYKLLDHEWQDFMTYNALDAEASYQLLQLFKKQLADKNMSHRLVYHMNEEIEQIRELIIQQDKGIRIDRDALNKHIVSLDMDMCNVEADFRQHPLVQPHLDDMEKQLIKDYYVPHITIKKVWAKKADEAWNNPKQWKAWKITGNGAKCATWEKKLGYRYYRKEVKIVMANENKPVPEINVQSNQQIANLIYGGVFKHEIHKESNTVDLHLPDKTITLELTDSGEVPVNKALFNSMGELGELLSSYSKAEKEKGYSIQIYDGSAFDGRIHPQFRPHGTVTSRLAGSGGINLAQQPKREGHLSCFIPDEGKVLIQLDFSALEPVIQTEFSKDETLKELYLAEKPNDLYLYWAQWIYPDLSMREEIHKAYQMHYAQGTLEDMKKQYKKQRSFIKVPCIAEGTPIRVQGKGYIPIDKVSKDDIVWDGEGWVRSEGTLLKGIKPTMTLEGVELTHDHLIKTKEGWAPAHRVGTVCEGHAPERPNRPSGTWGEVWKLGNKVLRDQTTRWLQNGAGRLRTWRKMVKL